jgi:carbonic anhydrase
MDVGIKRLIDGNKEWYESKLKLEPHYFDQLQKGQSPQYLWIGCSDSRVPANEITNTQSGEIFVHRNVANLVFQNDLNLLAIVQYSVEVLGVKDIVICGHYSCGGVRAAIEGASSVPLTENWISQIRMLYEDNLHLFENLENLDAKVNRLVEFNVIKQVKNLSLTSVLRNFWKKNQQQPRIHGFVYDLRDGVLKDLGFKMGPNEVIPDRFAEIKI